MVTRAAVLQVAAPADRHDAVGQLLIGHVIEDRAVGAETGALVNLGAVLVADAKEATERSKMPEGVLRFER